ncbi:MAG: hypothetical protein AAF456_08515 [Planctomycetota bacterium]
MARRRGFLPPLTLIVIAVFLVLLVIGNPQWTFWGAVVGIALLSAKFLIRQLIWMIVMAALILAVLYGLGFLAIG